MTDQSTAMTHPTEAPIRDSVIEAVANLSGQEKAAFVHALAQSRLGMLPPADRYSLHVSELALLLTTSAGDLQAALEKAKGGTP